MNGGQRLMAKKELPLDTEIEVVLRKKMTYGDYLKLRERDQKGWKIDAYQIGFFKKL